MYHLFDFLFQSKGGRFPRAHVAYGSGSWLSGRWTMQGLVWHQVWDPSTGWSRGSAVFILVSSQV